MENHRVKEKNHLFGKKKIALVLVVIVVIVVAVVVSMVKNMSSQIETTANQVQIEPVEKRDLSDSVSLKGTIAGVSKTNVMSIAAAEITAVNVQVGDIVEAGDALVTLDKEDIEKEIADLQTSIQNANAIEQNDARQKRESLADAKEDQTSALSKASDAINKAQADYDEIVNKRTDCENTIANKKNELNNSAGNRESAKQQMAEAKNNYDAAVSAAAEEPENEELANNVKEAEEVYAQKQELYNSLASYCEQLTSEITSKEAELATYADSLKAAQEAIDTARTGYADTKTSTSRSVESAQNTVDMQKYQTSTTSDAKDQLDKLEKQLTDCTLSAPCAGVVTAVNVSVGDKNTAGQTLITIEDTSSLKVIVSVDEADILKLEEGMTATITTDATGDTQIGGTVTRVVRVKNQSAAGTSDTNTTTGYSAEITIDNTKLLVGMTAKAKIIIKDRGSKLAVPYDLIRQDENGESYVLVAETNGDGTAVAVRKNVTVGEEVDYYTEVTGGDLKEGDLLIYDYTGSITEGQSFSPEQTYSNQQFDTDSMMSTEAE